MSFLSTKLIWLILQFFHIALSGIDDCTNQLKRVADTNDNPIVFNGTCYETGRDYAAPECQTWNVNVILALRSNTTESVLQEIENLISYTVKDCDYRSSLTFYMIGYSEYECGMKCEIGSLECENLLHRINLTTASINITDNGDVIVRFFENLSKCANSSTFIQGGAVFFITNVPCMSMCTQ
uniref:Uncharacterized protein n=1 Tax=Parascaris equorum TaxID=6256 RepID=A0A914RTR5_PAREQ